MADEQTLNQQEHEQQELVRPPDGKHQSDRSSTRLELFFDLAFVLFMTRCADLLTDKQTWHAAGLFAALLTVGWWSWASTMLYANRFDTDDVAFRALTLTAMGGVVVMAASVGDVSGEPGRWFTFGYVLVRLALIAGYARAWHHVPDGRPNIVPYAVGHSLGAAIWASSLVFGGTTRWVLWGVGVAVDMVGPVVAARRREGVPLHSEHLPERFGLLVILVLGESVAGVVGGLHEGGWGALVVVCAGLAFFAAATLWWLYFDFSGGAAKRGLVQHDPHHRGGMYDVYVYAHLALAIGLTAVAVGLEHAVLHGDDDHLKAGSRAVLGGGLALYLASVTLLQARLSRRWQPVLTWPGAGVPVALLLTRLDVRAPVLLLLVCGLLLAGLVGGIAEHRAGWVRTAKV